MAKTIAEAYGKKIPKIRKLVEDIDMYSVELQDPFVYPEEVEQKQLLRAFANLVKKVDALNTLLEEK